MLVGVSGGAVSAAEPAAAAAVPTLPAVDDMFLVGGECNYDVLLSMR